MSKKKWGITLNDSVLPRGPDAPRPHHHRVGCPPPLQRAAGARAGGGQPHHLRGHRLLPARAQRGGQDITAQGAAV